MLKSLLDAVAILSSDEAQNVLVSAGERVVKNYKGSKAWEKLIVGTGKFFVENEQKKELFFEDLECALSKENLISIAAKLKSEDGYDLKHGLYQSFMQLMRKYEIPYEIAESYTMRMIYTVLGQLRVIDPDKYEHHFLKEWREEQEKSFSALQNRIEKMSNELIVYHREQLAIMSSGQMDIELRRNTQNPSLGIEFFVIDDEHFQDSFQDQRYEKMVYIRGRNREETVYCILNELWRLDDRRPIYVVKNLESWNKLQLLENKGNVYIPCFYADEIVAIENNTNIFVIDENTPVFNKPVLELRPRTQRTLAECLKKAGMDYNEVNALLTDTHGLYTQIKKKLFKGEYLKLPSWIDHVSDRAKKTCLLIGSWEEIAGDKLIIESLYGDSYDRFLEEVLPYAKGEDPLIYEVKHNGSVSYYLASTENIWGYLNVSTNERIWSAFVTAVLDVLNESENLFIYDNYERIHAQLKGEKLFWSETIRKGMLKTLMIKGEYYKEEETQATLDGVVKAILKCVKTEEQWIYISKFWLELCEISPTVVMERLEKELDEDTGLLSLFREKSNDVFGKRDAYMDILWGIEQFLSQKEYFWTAFRWLLKLDACCYEGKFDSLKTVFEKVFCTWVNFSPLQTAEEKIKAAEIALEIDSHRAWEYMYSAIDHNKGSICGDLLFPKYRRHEETRSVTICEMQKTDRGYVGILIKHMEFSVDRWIKIINLLCELPEDLCKKVFNQLLYEVSQMTDEEVMQIKNEIRHLIYTHRYYSSTNWSMTEERLQKFENLLDEIHIDTLEYEYSYLFERYRGYPLLHPIPFNREGERKNNEVATQELVREKLIEFHELGYDLQILAKACAKESDTSLGKYLAMYWNGGKWKLNVFIDLLNAQESGEIALDYLKVLSYRESLPYYKIIKDLSNGGYPVTFLAKIYRVEASRTKEIPLVTNAPDTIKKEFWKTSIDCESCNIQWVLIECKKYATVDVYLDQMHQIHYENPLSADQIFECFEKIERMPQSGGDQSIGYHAEQLIGVMQKAYWDNPEKCIRVAGIELFFMDLLDWKSMKCYHHMIKQEPKLFAQLVNGIFKKDHGRIDEQLKDQICVQNMYKIYEKAHFCPTENNGEVLTESLEQWIERYKQLLIDQDQKSLFTATLGRLFAFSPEGLDGHEPCESVRNMIEKYGDDRMYHSYQIEVYNRRGVYCCSAGKEELKMADEFEKNAQYLEPNYPKTAKIFYGLSKTYESEAKRERVEAENDW